jgi:peroxidase
MTRTPTASPYDSWPIQVPSCDQYFDPQCLGNKTMMFGRSLYDTNSASRMQINAITSFLDASMVYGSDDSKCY